MPACALACTTQERAHHSRLLARGTMPFQANTAASATTSAEYTNAKLRHTNGSVTLSSGMARKSKLSASFSAGGQSRARSDGTVNIQIDHILRAGVCRTQRFAEEVLHAANR